MLNGKKVVLGITGSIAAYKAANLVRLLVKEGAEVKVIMTPSAKEFITPLTLSTLSKNPVLTEFVKDETGQWNNHVDLGLWGDLMVIAPASANTIAKFANGICDTLLDAVYLSARCPVILAPAMDRDMYIHPATQDNLDTLRSYGNHLIDPGYGELASGLTGQGRMAEPEDILTFLHAFISSSQRLKGKKALVTAGPTYEAIDPVRFIGNHSSGKMGFALAEELAKEGAEVTLVTGPTHLSVSHPNITVNHVTSSEEMYEACSTVFPESEITILAAAVADYKPTQVADRKIKKTDGDLSLNLVQTHDIAKLLGSRKSAKQIIVGFALETDNEVSNAITKLEAKNFDLIVLNSPNTGSGFGADTNKVSIIDRQKQVRSFEIKSKKEVAQDIVDAILALNPVHA